MKSVIVNQFNGKVRIIPAPQLNFQVQNLKAQGFKLDMSGSYPECHVRRLELQGKLWS